MQCFQTVECLVQSIIFLGKVETDQMVDRLPEKAGYSLVRNILRIKHISPACGLLRRMVQGTPYKRNPFISLMRDKIILQLQLCTPGRVSMTVCKNVSISSAEAATA